MPAVAKSVINVNSSHLPQWNLKALTPGPEIASILATAVTRARSLAARWRGQLASASPAEIIEILAEVGSISQVLQRPAAYLTLRFADGSAEDADLGLEAAVIEASTAATEALAFFVDEWAAKAATIDDAIELSPYGDYLDAIGRSAAHRLPAEHEAMLNARENAVQAWIDLYEGEIANIEVTLDSGRLTIEEALVLLSDSDHERRRTAFEALATSLQSHADIVARSMDALFTDRLAVDKARGYSTPREERDLENAISPTAVANMLTVVGSNTAVAHDWWHTKADLLGLDRLHLADMRAPLGDGLHIPFATAIDLIMAALDEVSPVLAEPVRMVVRAGTIDAASRAGKAGNAFCLLPGQTETPFVLINYGGRPRDLISLAHELGHAVHFVLSARRQPPLVSEAGLIISELAAFLVEAVVADHLLQTFKGNDLAEFRSARADYAIDAVFRQVAITRWEDRNYAARADGERLTAQRLGENWLAEYSHILGDRVSITDSYQYDWMRVSHAFQGRYYNYSYVFSFLMSLVVNATLPLDSRAGKLIEFLSSGASLSMELQIALLGVPVGQQDIWVEAVEQLAAMCKVVS